LTVQQLIVLGTFASGPLRAKVRQRAMYLFATDSADAVTAFIGASPRSILNATSRYDFSNDIRQFRNILIGSPDVEGLVVSDIARTVEHLPTLPQ
jgi:hypothetical protein